MRILTDACVDPRVTELFPDHEVVTAFDLGWHALADREIVRRCNGRFDVLLTADRGFEYEHNRSAFPFGVLIVHVRKNKIEFYRALRDELSEAVNRMRPGEVRHVGHRMSGHS